MVSKILHALQSDEALNVLWYPQIIATSVMYGVPALLWGVGVWGLHRAAVVTMSLALGVSVIPRVLLLVSHLVFALRPGDVQSICGGYVFSYRNIRRPSHWSAIASIRLIGVHLMHGLAIASPILTLYFIVA